jgi:hypothetical protein
VTPQPARPMHAVFARRAPGRSTLFTTVALLFCVSLALHAQDEDAEVLSAALRHYSNSKRNPLLVIAAETIETGRISLGRFERAEAPEIPASIRRELHNRSLKARPIAGIQLPANAMIVREAISMTRHVTPGGAEVADWSPFTHAYPGYQLLQLSVPAYFNISRLGRRHWCTSGQESAPRERRGGSISSRSEDPNGTSRGLIRHGSRRSIPKAGDTPQGPGHDQ